MSPASARARQLRGWLDLVNFMATHEQQVPIPTTITYDVRAETDMDGFEQVARIAHRMGVTPVTTPNGTHRAEKKFGPVTYAVVYHPMHATAVTR